MKTENLITGLSITLIAAFLLMIIAAFSFHGFTGFFNMNEHHKQVTSSIVKTNQTAINQ